jgi:hypothetical protein
MSDLMLKPQWKELRAILDPSLFTVVFSGATP